MKLQTESCPTHEEILTAMELPTGFAIDEFGDFTLVIAYWNPRVVEIAHLNGDRWNLTYDNIKLVLNGHIGD